MLAKLAGVPAVVVIRFIALSQCGQESLKVRLMFVRNVRQGRLDECGGLEAG